MNRKDHSDQLVSENLNYVCNSPEMLISLSNFLFSSFFFFKKSVNYISKAFCSRFYAVASCMSRSQIICFVLFFKWKNWISLWQIIKQVNTEFIVHSLKFCFTFSPGCCSLLFCNTTLHNVFLIATWGWPIFLSRLK